MSGERIEQMEPGPEMDALVASQVMGWREDQTDVYGPLFCPSTDINAAMRVVDQMERSGAAVDLRYSSANHSWTCQVDGLTHSAPTAALAICRVAMGRNDQPVDASRQQVQR